MRSITEITDEIRKVEKACRDSLGKATRHHDKLIELRKEFSEVVDDH